MGHNEVTEQIEIVKLHDAFGGAVEWWGTPLGDSKAAFSLDGRYRYSLERIWDKSKPRWCFIMLKPSTAGAVENDPAVTRCIRRAKAAGAGGLIVVNLYAWRATDPSELRGAADPVGPFADDFITAAVFFSSRVVCAWGAYDRLKGRDRAVLELLGHMGTTPLCLGLTKDGHPRHPLYLANDVEAHPMPPAAWAA